MSKDKQTQSKWDDKLSNTQEVLYTKKFERAENASNSTDKKTGKIKRDNPDSKDD